MVLNYKALINANFCIMAKLKYLISTLKRHEIEPKYQMLYSTDVVILKQQCAFLNLQMYAQALFAFCATIFTLERCCTYLLKSRNPAGIILPGFPKQLIEKYRECHNHKPQSTPGTKMKRKRTKISSCKINKQMSRDMTKLTK